VEIFYLVDFIFLFLANNKTLTRDNLAKRRKVGDASCLFCRDRICLCHLVFECCVTKAIWKDILEIFGWDIGADFESVTRWWLCNKK
jgi:hypothetical protein